VQAGKPGERPLITWDARDRLETKKKMISLYVRGDVQEWLRSRRPGHLTRINDILTIMLGGA
jgi:uncharacterized protein (DUF4415 family)